MSEVKSALRFMLWIHLAFSIVGAGFVAAAYDGSTGIWFLFGGLLMLFNLAVHVFAWPRLLAKKSIALSIGVIVFKFAILGWIIYEAANGPRIAHLLGLNPDSFSLAAFAGGLVLIVPSVFATALRVSFKNSGDSAVAPETTPPVVD